MYPLLSLILLIRLQLALAFPASPNQTLARSRRSSCAPSQIAHAFNVLRHNRTISNDTSVSLATVVVDVETLHVTLPSATATLTELLVLSTELPTFTTITSVQHSSTTSLTTISTAGVSSTLSSTKVHTYSSVPVASSLAATSHSRTLSAGSLIIVAIAGSVAINTIGLILWLCLRRPCSHDAKQDSEYVSEKEGHDVGDQDAPSEKTKNTLQHDSVSPGIAPPDQPRSPRALSIQQRFPFFSSSFWSSTSSWSLHHARAQEEDTPRRFTTFGLNTPVNPEPPAESPISVMDGRAVDTTTNEVPHISGNDQIGRALTVPSFRKSGDESTVDPRSPRRHSIPLFMENYTSPSLANHLPPESRSTIIMESRRGSHSLRTSSLMHGVESQIEGEDEDDGVSRHVTTSMISLPSVSSGVMTPRRHWTFVDVHGPSGSAVPASPQDLSTTMDRLSGAESSRTVSQHGQTGNTSPDFFTSVMSSRAPLSELPTAPSFFPSENREASTSSGFTQYRSALSVDDTLRDRRNI